MRADSKVTRRNIDLRILPFGTEKTRAKITIR